MAFWGGPRLAEQIPKLGIVKPYDEKLIDCNAYTLCMGDECYISTESGLSFSKNKKRYLKEDQYFSDGQEKIIKKGENFVIPPGQFAFLLTQEVVSIPENMMGFISLRSGIKFKGLVNISGFHVDPGFKGNLIYSVFNAGPSQIHLARGETVFKLWLTDLEGPIEKKYVFPEGTGQNEIPNSLISEVSRPVHSIQQLSERVTNLEHTYTIIKGLAVILVSLAGLGLAALKLIPGTTWTKLITFFQG